MQTLTVDLAEGADPHQTLWRIGYEILLGGTSGTEDGCAWEIKEAEAVPDVPAPKRSRVRLCACTEGLVYPGEDCPACGGTGEVQE